MTLCAKRSKLLKLRERTAVIAERRKCESANKPRRRAAHRTKMKREKPEPGQESVWDYPRPPRLESSSRTVSVMLAGQQIACSANSYRILETSHPPSWYVPREYVRLDFVNPTRKQSFCEWKGLATYWTVRIGNIVVEDAAWSYESPTPAFHDIQGCFAFYPNRLECYIDDERVQPQPGGFYGGWITKDLAGPFKGIPGSSGW